MTSSLLLLLAALHLATAQSDCFWNINGGLPSTQALYIKPGGSKDILGFWLPQSGDLVTVPNGGQVLVACPGSTLSAINAQEATLTCVGGTEFKDSAGVKYTFSSLGCVSIPSHTARRSGSSCEIAGPYSLVEIGFKLSNGDFYTVQETCFEDDTTDALYSVYLQTNSIAGYEVGFPRPNFVQGTGFYPSGMNVDNLYTQNSQRAAVARAVGSTELADQYVQANTDYFMSRGHLTAKADYVYGSHQRATFYFMNVAPQWQTFNGGNWNTLEDNVRNYAGAHNDNLFVYTGTHGTQSLADVNGNQVPIYLYYDANGKGMIKSPAFFWKVVFEPSSGKGVAFIGLNNPYVDNPGSDFYLCPDVCSRLNWLTWAPNDQKKGYAYCCEVDALTPHVPEIPPLDTTGLLT